MSAPEGSLKVLETLGVDSRYAGHRLCWHKKGQDRSGKCDIAVSDNPHDIVYGVVYLMSGFRRYKLQAINLAGAAGDITAGDNLLWSHSRGTSYVPSSLLYDDKIYFLSDNSAVLSCLDTKTGEQIWERRFPLQHAVGPGSSPIVWQDLIVLVCDGMDTQYVIALDKHTGETAWKTKRPPMSGDNGDFHKAYCTPLAIEWNGKSQLLIPGAQWFVSYEPTEGNMLWYINHGKGFSNVASPVFDNGISYLITGFTKPELWAVPVSSSGELTAQDVLWEQKKQVPKKSSPALHGDDIYMVGDTGILTCVDVNSGELRWTARLGGNYSASPIFTDGRIYFCSHEGKTTVVKPNSEKFESIAENQLDGQLMASPVPSDGALFIRSDKHLYRLEQK